MKVYSLILLVLLTLVVIAYTFQFFSIPRSMFVARMRVP
jgi:hypothetical protein